MPQLKDLVRSLANRVVDLYRDLNKLSKNLGTPEERSTALKNLLDDPFKYYTSAALIASLGSIIRHVNPLLKTMVNTHARDMINFENQASEEKKKAIIHFLPTSGAKESSTSLLAAALVRIYVENKVDLQQLKQNYYYQTGKIYQPGRKGAIINKLFVTLGFNHVGYDNPLDVQDPSSVKFTQYKKHSLQLLYTMYDPTKSKLHKKSKDVLEQGFAIVRFGPSPSLIDQPDFLDLHYSSASSSGNNALETRALSVRKIGKVALVPHRH